ncbi:MAG: DUF58 domain-containing protein [Planctomycetota bacterium]
MRADCARACAPYRLVLPTSPLAGRAGDRLGRGTGSSLEFMDFRDYAPGDDLRHIDWRSYARTDQLKVRLFREEISPELEIVADFSPSMGSSERKERALRDLVGAAAHWAQRAAGRARCLLAGGGALDDIEGATLSESTEPLPRLPLRPRSLRVWVSDFLFPGDPTPLLRRFANGAAHVYIVQLLDPWELDPEPEGLLRLLDVEAPEEIEIDLNERAVTRYRERLGRLRDGILQATRSVGGSYACVAADDPATMFRTALLPQGIIEPD